MVAWLPSQVGAPGVLDIKPHLTVVEFSNLWGPSKNDLASSLLRIQRYLGSAEQREKIALTVR